MSSGAMEVQQALAARLAAPKPPTLAPADVASRLGRALAREAGVREMAQRSRGANSLEGAMDTALATILAAEAAAEAFAEIADDVAAARKALDAFTKGAKAALTQAFADSGNPRCETETHTASPAKGRGGIEVIEPEAVPFEFCKTLVVPDMDAIEAEYRAGRTVPGTRKKEGKAGIRILPRRRAA